MTAMLRTCLAGIVAAGLVGCADTDSSAPHESAETAAITQQEGSAPTLAQEAGDLDRTGLECYKLLAHNGDFKSKYKVGSAKDKYLNFTFKAPWQGLAYGIVFNPIIDNKKVLHHWLLFQTPASNAVGISPSIGAHPAGALLSGWAPGGEPVDFRTLAADTQVGLELAGTNTYTIEFHYNSSDAEALDASGVEVCVQKEKPKEIAGLSWLGYDQLAIPAKEWTGTCKPTAQQKINIIGVVPHMHKTGTHIKGIINRADGTKETLIDKPFDFDYQIQYRTPAVLNPGDSVTTTCTFDKPMAFGERTTEEMCYLFTLSWPKGLLADNGAWGTFAHGANACLGQ